MAQAERLTQIQLDTLEIASKAARMESWNSNPVSTVSKALMDEINKIHPTNEGEPTSFEFFEAYTIELFTLFGEESDKQAVAVLEANKNKLRELGFLTTEDVANPDMLASLPIREQGKVRAIADHVQVYQIAQQIA